METRKRKVTTERKDPARHATGADLLVRERERKTTKFENGKCLLVFDIAIRTIVGHHLLEFLKVNVSVAIRINGFDHIVAFLNGALHSEPVQNLTKLSGRDQAVLVLVVKVEGVTELRSTAVCASGTAEGGKLREVNEAVVIGVEVFHDAFELFRRDSRSERAEDVVQLVDGDLAIAVGVEAAEDSLQSVHVFEVQGGFDARLVLLGDGWIRCHG